MYIFASTNRTHPSGFGAIKKVINNYETPEQIEQRINKDYSDDKIYYICRWLNHSFMPFTKKQEEYYKLVKLRYEER